MLPTMKFKQNLMKTASFKLDGLDGDTEESFSRTSFIKSFDEFKNCNIPKSLIDISFK